MCYYKKIILVIITTLFASLICSGSALCAPPAAPPGNGQQVCQSGPCVDSAAIIDGQVNTQDLAVGAVGAAQLQNDAVTGANVLDGSLTGADIQDNSIGSADIAPGAIGTGHLSDGSVNGAKVLDGSLAGADIQDGSIGTADIAPGAIGTGQLSDGAVTGTKVQAGSLTGAHMQDGSLTGLQILDGSIVSADIAPGAVGTGQLSDGAVTGAKIGAGSLTGANIQDGSIDTTKVGFNYAGSDSKGGPALDLTCSGCVSKSELDFTIAGSAARRIVVAASGGDFTSIQAAINSISPSATNPYVIEVMPGTYVEDITMKSYVHLKGAGREVTTIQGAVSNSSTIVLIDGCSNVQISGLALKGGWIGIYSKSASMVSIVNNAIAGNKGSGIRVLDSSSIIINRNNVTNNISGSWQEALGIQIVNSSLTMEGNYIAGNSSGVYSSKAAPRILGNTITGNTGTGITNYQATSPIIIGNVITNNNAGIVDDTTPSSAISGNVITGNANEGILVAGASPTIIGNTVMGNGGSGGNGIYVTHNATWLPSNPKIMHNIVTGNGGGYALTADIAVNHVSVNTPNISFNVYDKLSGTGGVGQYNVNSNGDPAPAP